MGLSTASPNAMATARAVVAGFDVDFEHVLPWVQRLQLRGSGTIDVVVNLFC